MDDRNTISTGYILITVLNRPPVANFTVDPMIGDTTTIFTFTFNGSDSDGSIVTYLWDFGDDTNSSNVNPFHSFTASGEYTVNLTIWDDDGSIANATINITITNAPPVAVVASKPTIWATGEPLSLDGSASYDPEGNLTGLRWELSNGMNSTNGVFGLSLPTGNYTIWFNLTDAHGLSTDVTWPMQVEPRPVAIISSDRAVAAVGQAVFLNGNSSTGARDWLWDLDDSTNSTQADGMTHTYDVAGNYTVTLTLTSPLGLVSDETNASRVSVLVVPLPVADLTLPVGTHHQWLPLTLNATGSQAGWGELSYSYRIGTGDWTPWAANATYSFNPSTGGNQTLEIRVRDATGCVDQANRTVYLNWAPRLEAVLESLSPEVNQVINFTLEVTDQDDNQTELFLDWGDGMSSNQSLSLPYNQTFSHVFNSQGEYELQAALTLDGGERLSWSWTVNVRPEYVEPEEPEDASVDLKVEYISAFAAAGGALEPSVRTKLSAIVSWSPGPDVEFATLFADVEFTLDGVSLKIINATLTADQALTLSTEWTATKGSHILLVEIDPKGAYNDSDIDNNQATHTFNVEETQDDGGGFLPAIGVPLSLSVLLLATLLVRRSWRSREGNH